MSNKFRIFWSSVLTFVMVFLLSVQPHAVLAENENVPSPVQETTEIGPDGVSEPEVLPLVLAPVAASAFTSTVVNSIFAAALGWYVGYEAQSLFQGSVNDKKYTSTATYTLTQTARFDSTFEAWAGEVLTTSSASKHMEQGVVLELHNRIKNYSNETNFRSYSSTEEVGNMLYVIDIGTSLPSNVNRHLGNNIAGFTGYVAEDINFKNEKLDLAGYSVFIVTGKFNKEIFHAHFVPKWLRDREIEHARFTGQFNVQVHPDEIRDDKYLNTGTTTYYNNKKAARNNRGLLKDSKGRYSVVPYK